MSCRSRLPDLGDLAAPPGTRAASRIPERLFLLLWELPPALQLGGAALLIRRALALRDASDSFAHTHALLDQVERLAASDPHGRARVDLALWLHRPSCDALPWPERTLCHAETNLAVACNERWCPETLTSGAVIATGHSVTATAELTRRHTRPEAARRVDEILARAPDAPTEEELAFLRQVGTDPSEIAVRAAAWRSVLDHLSQSGLAGQPDVADRPRLVAALRRWRSHGAILVPART